MIKKKNTQQTQNREDFFNMQFQLKIPVPPPASLRPALRDVPSAYQKLRPWATVECASPCPLGAEDPIKQGAKPALLESLSLVSYILSGTE